MADLPEVREKFVADTSGYSGKLREAAGDADKFGDKNDKAALAARKMGLAAGQAADKAARAMAKAGEAAEKLAMGEIKADEAAQAEADALREVERAAIKAAEAERAAGKAADQAADNMRQLARDAELAAAAQQLGALKAAGAIKEHNSLVRKMRSEYGELDKVAKGAFNEVQTVGSRAFNSVSNAAEGLATSGPGSIALVVAALGSVPFVALGATSAISLGVGGALAGIGLMATKSDKEVQTALHQLTSHVKSETKQMSAPFKATWIEIAASGREAFDGLAPEIAGDLQQLAPVISEFAHEGAHSLTLLAPAFDAATNATERLLGALGPRLPQITGNIGHSIEIMANSAASSAPAFANMAVSISQVLPVAAHLLDLAVKVGPAVNLMYAAVSGGKATLGAFMGVLGLMDSNTTSMFVAIPSKASAAAASVTALQKDMATLANAESTAADKANALGDAFNRLLNPAEAVFNDTAKLKDSIKAMGDALKDSKGKINDNSAAARASKVAFTGMIDNAKTLASDLLNSGKSIDQVRAKLQPYIDTMYKAAGSNKQARALVDNFVRALDGVPANKKVSMTLDAQQFFSALHQAQGTTIDPKTGLLKGDNADYLNKWLRANGLRINPKTGLLKGDNADYYNKWLRANGLKISTKTGKITGNTSAFWAAVHAIPQTVGYRRIGVYYVPLNSANEPGKTRADGGIDRYADGGVRRDLQPFIATQPTVLFGETETGGEAYIPLGQSKRARSTELLAEVADMFGLAVVQPLADGIIEKYAKGKVKKPTKTQLAKAAATRSRALSRPEEIAALAAQQSLAAMRASMYGGFARGGRPGIGSSGSTVVQHVTTINVNVAGSIRSDQDLAKVIQRQLITNRMPVSLPAGR